MTFCKIWVLIVVGLITSCNAEQDEKATNLQLFKKTYQQGLIDLCNNQSSCEQLIEQYFEVCLNNELALKLLAAEQTQASELSIELVKQTMSFIEQYQQH